MVILMDIDKEPHRLLWGFSVARMKGGELVTKVYCNTSDCAHNEDDVCQAAMIYCVNRRCRTRRTVSTRDLMQGASGSRCQKSGGSYKNKDIKVLK